jgi:hypothetical protein
VTTLITSLVPRRSSCIECVGKTKLLTITIATLTIQQSEKGLVLNRYGIMHYMEAFQAILKIPEYQMPSSYAHDTLCQLNASKPVIM